MKSPIWLLQKNAYQRITKETAYKVYDDDPEQPAYPYIKTGEFDARSWSDKSKPGQEVLFKLHFWSRYPGKKEVAEMMDAVLGILTAAYPALGPEFNVVFQEMESNNILIDIDGATRHGILEMKYLVEEL